MIDFTVVLFDNFYFFVHEVYHPFFTFFEQSLQEGRNDRSRHGSYRTQHSCRFVAQIGSAVDSDGIVWIHKTAVSLCAVTVISNELLFMMQTAGKRKISRSKGVPFNLSVVLGYSKRSGLTGSYKNQCDAVGRAMMQPFFLMNIATTAEPLKLALLRCIKFIPKG